MAAVEDLEQAADDVEAFATKAVKMLGVGIGKAVRPVLKRDTGGDNRMSGVGNAKLSVSARTKGPGKTKGTVSAGPKKMTGPWRWLEDGVRPHAQGRGQHPGTRAKRTWSKPVDRAVSELERDVTSAWDRTFR